MDVVLMLMLRKKLRNEQRFASLDALETANRK